MKSIFKNFKASLLYAVRSYVKNRRVGGIVPWLYETYPEARDISDSNRLFFFTKKILRHPRKLYSALSGKELNIPYVEVVLTTVCTLKCQGCSALMTYYKHPSHMDVDTVKKSLKTLLDAVDSIKLLRLLGGEPLGYPHLEEILSFLLEQEKVKEIGIVTNGTLLIKNDRLLELLKNKKALVFISDYGQASRNIKELSEQLRSNGIRMRISFSNSNESWIDYGGFAERNRTEAEVQKMYRECTHKCRSLLNGKLFQCQRCSHGTYLGLLPLVEGEYVELLNRAPNESPDVLRKKLQQFVFGKTSYPVCCKYCDMVAHPKLLQPGVQLNSNNNLSNSDE